MNAQIKTSAMQLLTWSRSSLTNSEQSSLGSGHKPGSGTDVVFLLAVREGGLEGENQPVFAFPFFVFVIVPGRVPHMGKKK